jgi:hypothetical protein
MWGQPPSAVHRAKLDYFSSQSSNMPAWKPRQTPYQARTLIVFHTAIAYLPKSIRSISPTEVEETLTLTCHLRDPAPRSCTNSGHPPVDAPHSPENAQLTNPTFPLTLKMKRVKT